MLDLGQIPPQVEVMNFDGKKEMWLTGVVHRVGDESAVVITHVGPVDVDPHHAHVLHNDGGVISLGVRDAYCDISHMSVVCVPSEKRSGKPYFPWPAYKVLAN